MKPFSATFALAIFLFAMHSASYADPAGVQPDRKIVSRDGVKVEYFVFGAGRETLLMFPGNARSAKDLAGVARLIA